MAKASISNIGALCAAFLNKPIRLPDVIMDIRKMKNRDVASQQIGIHGPVSPSWFASSNAKLAEDGGMGLADYSPVAENLYAFSGVTPTDNQSLYSESTDATEKTDQDIFGGSNESLAEKLSLLFTDHLPESDCSIEENDVLSINSLISNEAEAVSQDCSPLKSATLQLSCSLNSCSLNTEESQVLCGGEALADEPSSISEINLSFVSMDSCSTTSAPSGVLTPDNMSSAEHMSDDASLKCNTMKPPNILIFTGEDSSKEPCLRFNNILYNLQCCLNRDCYSVYLITPLKVLSDPWIDSTGLLIISCGDISSDVMTQFSTFIKNGGKVLSCCSQLNLPFIGISSQTHLEENLIALSYKNSNDAILYQGQYRFKYPSTSIPLAASTTGGANIIKVPAKNGLTVLSEVHLEVDPFMLCPDVADLEILKQSNMSRLHILHDLLSTEFGLQCCSLSESEIKLTPCYLLTKNKDSLHKFLEAICPSLKDSKLQKKDLMLHFICCSSFDHSYETTSKVLPILYDFSSHSQTVPFDERKFFSRLTTKTFGNILMYSAVMTSTMDVIESLSDSESCVVIAGRQTQGKGRCGNKWLSPEGCAMFSVHYCTSLSSQLGQALPIVQHLASLAVVHGIRKIPEYKPLDLRLKWPNDIYYGGKNKIGGLLVNCSVQDRNVHFYIGCGLNVSNTQPTLCINDIIHLYNHKTGKSLNALTIEDVIATSLNELENLIEDFQKSGPSSILPLYYSYWLHENERVTISHMNKEGTIAGLDDYGFLVVKTDDGQKVTLQPDGNRFDSLKNLIYCK